MNKTKLMSIISTNEQKKISVKKIKRLYYTDGLNSVDNKDILAWYIKHCSESFMSNLCCVTQCWLNIENEKAEK